VAVGESCGDRDLVAFARNLEARALMRMGKVDEGLALVDEVMLAAASGELAPLVAGLVYCSVIASCQQVYALDRAREWTEHLDEWCSAQPQLVMFSGRCLVHRAEILQLCGSWGQAASEARRAFERFHQAVDPEAVGDACYQQGEIHRLRGEDVEAERAYSEASRYGREPQPGLALLRLAQGRVDAAAAALGRIVAGTSAPLARAQFLPALVEVSLAARDADAARAAAAELSQIAARFRTDVLDAMAAGAEGAVALAAGDSQAALPPLRRAFRIWQRVGAPYLAARIRVLAGRACGALGDEDGSRLELGAARTVFEELGAAPDLLRLDGPPPDGSSRSCHGLTPRELEVLRRIASGSTNRAIARELHVSERTVDRHVSNILAKLEVSSRSGATAFAYEHELV
jgi:DNA-binding NarL/FixJ family response regulator